MVAWEGGSTLLLSEEDFSSAGGFGSRETMIEKATWFGLVMRATVITRCGEGPAKFEESMGMRAVGRVLVKMISPAACSLGESEDLG